MTTDPNLAQRIYRSGWILAVVLTLPCIGLLMKARAWPWDDEAFGELMHGSGELSVRLLIASLLATPLQRVFPKARFVKWLRRRRRTFGLAAFGYAVLHLGLYLAYRPPPELIADLAKWTYLAGWLAFLLMLPLAITSNDALIKKLGTNWRRLHRLAYLIAGAAALHWLTKPDGGTLGPVLVHFLPLVVLQANRFRVGRARVTA